MPNERSDEHPLLGPLGIDPLDERIYRYLLSDAGASDKTIASAVGATRREVNEALAHLQAEGMVTKRGGKAMAFVAMAPEVVIDSLTARRREEIERVRAIGAKLIREAVGPGSVGDITGLVTVIEGQNAMRQHCRQLVSTAREELVGFERPPYSAPAEEHRGTSPALERGLRCRFIYEPGVIEVEGHLDLLRAEIEAGEEARVLPELPVWMLIADRSIGLVPLDLDKQSAGGAVLIHSSWLLDALLTLFEALWDKAVPLPSDLDGWEGLAGGAPLQLSDLDRRILTMMAAGSKDSMIARQLGVDPSTVRRRIARMTRLLGGQSRFQAGVQAARKGLI